MVVCCGSQCIAPMWLHVDWCVLSRRQSSAHHCPLCRAVLCCHPAGYARRGEDGQLHFKGLVASTDGKKIYETSRVGAFSAEEGERLGREAGEELKAQAGPEFFVW